MNSFEKTSTVNCNIDELFDFHLDIKNLKNITPLDTSVELLNKEFIPHESGILKIKTIKHYIPTIWEVQIAKIERPNILIDVALKSPFKLWKHSHVFTRKGNVCELKDIVEYKLPFGAIGKLFDSFIQKELRNMFEFRHRITKEILESKA